MGINGLLPFLENSSRSVHISQFRGCSAAVDSYCWLHKGAFGCSERLARGEETNGYVLYCLKYLRILQNAGVRPIMVFDGQHLPAKRETEEKRREQRKVARKRAAELLRLDRANEARNYLRQCIDVTHDMALALIKECRRMGVDCIVAPYEADAQLAYLNIKKIVDFVITEDSDLVLFGCNKILFKLDLMGHGTLIETEKLYLSMQMSPDMYNFDKFRYMCILSGCDYIQSLPGIGLKKALKFLKLTGNPDIYQVLTKLPSYLNMRQIIVTDEYRDEFMVALATFKHQIVYNPLERKLVRLTDPELTGTKIEHCRNAGEFFDDETAFQLALGNLDPFSLKKVDDWHPDKVPLKPASIWSKDYKKIVSKTKPPSPPLARKIKSTKNIDVIVEVSSIDDDFEEELKSYKIKKVEKVEEIDYKAKEEEENVIQSTLSQRKLFNPFIRETKIARTTIDTSRIVKSRFFNKTNSNLEASSSQTQISELDSEGAETFKDQYYLERSENNSVILNIDTLCAVMDAEANEEVTLQREHTQTSNGANKLIIKERFGLIKNKKAVAAFSNNDTSGPENGEIEITEQCRDSQELVLVERSTKDKDNSSNIEERSPLDKRKRSDSTDGEDDSNTENLTPPCRVENTVPVKKSNLGPCRSFGLQKRNVKKMSAKNQPTLLSMFAAIKK